MKLHSYAFRRRLEAELAIHDFQGWTIEKLTHLN